MSYLYFQKLKLSVRPSPNWVPANSDYSEQYKASLENGTTIPFEIKNESRYERDIGEN